MVLTEAAEAFLQDLRVHAGLQPRRWQGWPHVAQPHARRARVAAVALEALRQAVGVDWLAVGEPRLVLASSAVRSVPASSPTLQGATMSHVIAIVLVVVAIACSGGAGQSVAVDIVDFEFDPARVEVRAGSTVAWTYDGGGSSVHTVTFEDGEESGDLEPGDTYERTFDAAGEYAYVCFYHPSMTGTVSVVG